MGWVETRDDRGGRPRYIAKYRDLRGRKQSAGTFTRKREPLTLAESHKAHCRRPQTRRARDRA